MPIPDKRRIEALFGNALRQRAINNVVPANVLQERLRECLSLRAADEPWPDDITITLIDISVGGSLEFPPGHYPALILQNVTFTEDVTLRNLTFQLGVSIENPRFRGPKGLLIDHAEFKSGLRVAKFGSAPLSLIDCSIDADAAIVDGFVERIVNCKFGRNLSLATRAFGAIRNITVANTFTIRPPELGPANPAPSEIAHSVFRGHVNAEKFSTDTPLTVHHCQFESDVSLKHAQLQHSAEVKQCTFMGKVGLEAAKLTAPLSFQHCTFAFPPDFHLVDSIHTDTSFAGCRFLSCSTRADLAAYRQLRRLLSTHVRSDYFDGVLFASEKRTEANLDLKDGTERFSAWLSKLYDLTSNYGQSIWRPFVALLSCFVIFVPIYWSHSSEILELSASGVVASGLGKSIGLWAVNTFAPFAVLVRTATYYPTTGFLRFLSVIQTLVTLIFVTILILAIRRRFRKTSE